MAIITPTYEDISIEELHNINEEDYNTIIVQIGRRNEPGAGRFAGVLLLTANEPIVRFNSKEKALRFIDAVQAGGIIEAMNIVTNNKTVKEHIETLQPTTKTVDHKKFIEQSGITDPFNLFINPQLEVERELSEISSNTQRRHQKTQP